MTTAKLSVHTASNRTCAELVTSVLHGSLACKRPDWLLLARRSRVLFIRAAAGEQSTPSPAAAVPQPPVEYIPDSEFSISKVSFGSILTPLGSFLLLYGFGAYFSLLPGTDLSPVMLVYGFPLFLLGAALSYAQLAPVPCKTTKAAFDLRQSQMTDIQKQIREDVTRYRYAEPCCVTTRQACKHED